MGRTADRHRGRFAHLAFWLLVLPAVLLTVAPGGAIASPYVWSSETVDLRGSVDHTSLALDTNGHPHIAYYESSGKDLRYAYHDGSAWILEDVETAGEVGIRPSITVDPAGRPHITYIDATTLQVKHAERNGTWRVEVVDFIEFARPDRGGSSATMGADGTQQVCYYVALDGVLKYARKVGPLWINETVDDDPTDAGQFCSITLDGNNRPHIAYAVDWNGIIRYARWDGTGWLKSNVDVPGAQIFCCTAIALNASGNPFIAHVNNDPASYDKLSYWDGSAWQTQVLSNSSMGGGCIPTLVFDSTDRLHAPCLAYRVWDSGTWVNEPTPIPVGSSVVLDALDQPHIGVNWNGDLYYVRGYLATQRPTAPRDLRATAGDGQVSLTWQAPSWNGGSAVTAYRVYRGLTPSPTALAATLGTVSAWTDSDVTNGITYYYRVAAVNAVGEGPPSNEASALPSGPGDDPPTCTIATPAAGLVMGNVTVSGTATDPEYSLDSVETRIDGGAWGAAIGTDPWSTTWDSSTVPDGTHAIEARAYDGALYSPVCSVTVTTDNGVVPPPDGDFLRDYGWVLAVFFATGIALALMVVLLRRRRTKGES